MAKANTNTKPKKPTVAERRRKTKQGQQSVNVYGKGCSSNYKLVMHWLSERQRTLPATYAAELLHIILNYMDLHHKARGAKRSFIKGEVVSLFSSLESPNQAISL